MNEHSHNIKVTVAFPISPTGPYRADDDSSTTIESVQAAAMQHFAIAADGQHAYYLTHNGVRAPADETLEQAADKSHAVKFTLVKELIQG